MNPKEILVKGLALLKEHGVAIGDFRNPEGAYCARGVILAAAGVSFTEREWGGEPNQHEQGVPGCMDAINLLIEANGIRSSAYDHWGKTSMVAGWSNNLVRDGRPEAVIEGFERAIQLAESRAA